MVREACIAWIENRLHAIGEQREKAILEAMQPQKLGPFTIRGARTRNEAIDHLENNWPNAYIMAPSTDSHKVQPVKNLLNLADAVIGTGGGVVAVSSKDAAIIF